MKDSDQKDDYYSVSKQPPMPMGAPPPPPPMGMPPMGMPMGGPMPPGAPMAPQGEELQEGEYIDPATGKIMTRGEEFKVDPDRELDDTKNIAKWFDTVRKRSAAPSWTQNFQQAEPYERGAQAYTYPIAGEKQVAEGRDPTGGTLDEFGYTQGKDNASQGFMLSGNNRNTRRVETTPALADMEIQREQDRYGARVAAYEKRRKDVEPTRRERLQGFMFPGQEPAYAERVEEADSDLEDARAKLEAAERGETPGPKYSYRPNEPIAAAGDVSIVERMPRPDAGETDAFGTPDMPYSQRFDTPSWMKEVKR